MADGKRIWFLDNLRTFMIFLVVMLHAGITYEVSSMSSLWWIVDDPAVNDLSGLINLAIDMFVMSVIFFVSGFFTPVSLKNRKGWGFIKSKFLRLIVPWAVAVLTVIPLYKVMFLYSRGLPQEHWTTYFHWSNGIFSQSWLWFLPIIFAFNLLYLLLAKIGLERLKIGLGTAVAAAFGLSLIYGFCIRMFDLTGWTKNVIVNFQNERLLIYFMFFLLGSLCSRNRTFDTEKRGKGLYYAVIPVTVITMLLYLFLLIRAYINPGVYIFSRTADLFILQLCFTAALFGLVYTMVLTFRFFFNRHGYLVRELGGNSYGVYIIHTVVLGGIAMILLQTGIPSLLKYAVLTLTAFIASNLIVFAYRKTAGMLIRGRKTVMKETAS